MFVAWVLSVSVEASFLISVLKLMLLVSVMSLSSIFSTSSFMALVKVFSDINGAVAALLLMAWTF